MRKFLFVACSAALLALTGVAQAQMPPTKIGNSAKGKVLTNDQGMTLYTFAPDTKTRSACNGPCAINWPPLMAFLGANPAGRYTIVVRDDGSRQWAYEGKPLYTWKDDHKPGDITGDGFNKGAWHIAKP